MLQPLLALPISMFLILISIAFGRRIMNLLNVESTSPVERNVFGLGIGLGVLAYVVLGAGLCNLLYWRILLAPMSLMALASLSEIGSLLEEIVGAIRKIASIRVWSANTLVTVSVVVLGALALIPALAPPAGMDWDALAYHLAVPKLYLRHHGIYHVLFTSHSNFPFLTEMLYTLGLSVHSTGAAKLFHFSMYLGTAAALYSLGRRYLNPSVGRIAALLFMSIPVVLYEAGVAYADLTMGLYITLAFYAMLNWQETENVRWLIVCALMCGFALGTKVLTAIPILAICVLILFSAGKSRNWGSRFGLACLVGFGGLIVGSVWYIKAYIYTGNPVYPFLYNIFGGTNWNAEAAAAYSREQNSFGMGKDYIALFLLPWNLLANGFNFTNKPANVFALIGPAFIGLIPIHVFTGKLHKTILQACLVVLAFLVAWFMLMQHSRYLITVLPLLAIVAAAAADTAHRNWRFGKHAVNLFIALSVILAIYAGGIVASSSFKVVVGLEPQTEYLTRNLDVYRAENYINKELPPRARIILFDEVRGFYLDRSYIWGNPNHNELIPWQSFHSGTGMVQWFVSHGYTHMLWNRAFATSNTDNIRGKLFPDAIDHGQMREIFSWHATVVYEFI